MGRATVFLELEQPILNSLELYLNIIEAQISLISKSILTWPLLKTCCIDKPSEIVLVNKVILARAVNIIIMVLRARSYIIWAGIIKNYCTKTFHLFLYGG